MHCTHFYRFFYSTNTVQLFAVSLKIIDIFGTKSVFDYHCEFYIFLVLRKNSHTQKICASFLDTGLVILCLNFDFGGGSNLQPGPACEYIDFKGTGVFQASKRKNMFCLEHKDVKYY